MDRVELSGAQQAGELLGVFLVGFDLVAGLLRDLGRCDDDAVVAELDQAAHEDEPGRPSLVADAQVAFFDPELLA